MQRVLDAMAMLRLQGVLLHARVSLTSSIFAVFFILFICGSASGQTSADAPDTSAEFVPITSTSTPLSLSQIGAALTGNTTVQSIEFSGTVVHDSGLPEQVSDPISITVDGDGATEIKVMGAGGTLDEVYAPAGIMGTCTGTSSSGTLTATPLSNCWSAASWVLPTLALANTTASQRLAAGISLATRNGSDLLALKMHILGSTLPTRIRQYVDQVSSRTIYLDPRTFLPTSMTYSAYPGNRTYIHIPVEMDYSDYRAVSGVVVPFRITKSVGGRTVLDITVAQVVVNP